MDLSNITAEDFKTFFSRDFPLSKLEDINRAFSEAKSVFNQGLYSNDDVIRIAYLYLTAHYLVLDFRARESGYNGGGFFPANSRSVGSVSESYSVPSAYTDNPVLAIYSSTNYGMKYLSITLPALAGNVVAVYGGTNP